MGKKTRSLLPLVAVCIGVAVFSGCLLADPDFTPHDRDTVLQSEKRVVVPPQNTPRSLSIKIN